MALVCDVWRVFVYRVDLAHNFGLHEIMFYFVLAFLVWLFATDKAQDWADLLTSEKTNAGA